MNDQQNNGSRIQVFNEIMYSYVDRIFDEEISSPLVGNVISNTDFAKAEVYKTLSETLQLPISKLQQLDNFELFLKKQSSRVQVLEEKRNEITFKRDAYLTEYNKLKDKLIEMTFAYQKDLELIQNEISNHIEEEAYKIEKKNECLDMILPYDVEPAWFKED